MAEWIEGINWIMVIAMMAGIGLGTEIQRRKTDRTGQIFTFLPRATSRFLNVAIGLTGGLFYQAASIGVSVPTEFNVWMLTIAASAAFLVFAVHMSLEFRFAKRALEAAKGAS